MPRTKLINGLNLNTVNRVLFYALLLFSLYTIWQVGYFVTGDGACHLHNAMAWRTMLFEPNAYYSGSYELNHHLIPNYFSHVVLAGLTLWFTPAISEKMLLTVYVLSFTFGFLTLAKQLGIQNRTFLLLVFPMLFQVFLFKGFYNYLFSISAYFFMLAYYIRCSKGDFTIKQWLFFLVFGALFFFIHVLGYLLFLLSAGIFLMVKHLPACKEKAGRLVLAKLIGIHILVFLPGLLPFLLFSNTQEAFIYFPQPKLIDLLLDFKAMTGLVSFTAQEAMLAKLLFILLMSMLTLMLIRAWVKKTFPVNSLPLFLILVLCVGVYFFYRDSALGGEQVKVRFQVISYILMVLLISFLELPRVLQSMLTPCCLIISAYMIQCKMEPLRKMDKVVKEIMVAEPLIQENSWVLPLCYHTQGVWQEKDISDHLQLMSNHVAHYLQSNHKALVFADNYEANTTYFPLTWKPGLNPFLVLPNFEAQPPEADVMGFNGIHPIHYVLIFNLRSSDRATRPYQVLKENLGRGYTLVYTSKSGNAELYRFNTKSLSIN